MVNIGVIGTGWWATEYHIPGVIENPGSKLVAVADVDPGRLEKASEAFGIEKSYQDYLEMIGKEELDGVIIATPHSTHYGIAKECLDRNLHILIEKPMTLFARDARYLVHLAGEKRVEILIGYTYHYYQQVQHVKNLISSGELGDIEYINCSFASHMVNLLSGFFSSENSPTRYRVHGPSENYNRPEMLGGGIGHLQLTHPIGYLLYITGLKPVRVQAMMRPQNSPIDMVDTINVEFEGGALGVIGGTGNTHSSYRMAQAVYCQKGSYIVDTQTRYAAIHKQDGETETLDWQPLSEKPYPVTNNFIDIIASKAENLAPGEIGWRVVELLDAAYRSVREENRVVRIEELYK